MPPIASLQRLSLEEITRPILAKLDTKTKLHRVVAPGEPLYDGERYVASLREFLPDGLHDIPVVVNAIVVAQTFDNRQWWIRVVQIVLRHAKPKSLVDIRHDSFELYPPLRIRQMLGVSKTWRILFDFGAFETGALAFAQSDELDALDDAGGFLLRSGNNHYWDYYNQQIMDNEVVLSQSCIQALIAGKFDAKIAAKLRILPSPNPRK